VTNVTSSSSTTQPSQDANGNNAAKLQNVLLNENPSQANMLHQSLLHYYYPNIANKGGLGVSEGGVT
jgi:hypothetical protein